MDNSEMLEVAFVEQTMQSTQGVKVCHVQKWYQLQ
jgi:hypothetical protein